LYTDRPIDDRNGSGGAFAFTPGNAQEYPNSIPHDASKSAEEVNPFLAKSTMLTPPPAGYRPGQD
jgi:hypothetical protein